MKCADCVCWFDNQCLADPNWPAPCEYDDEEEEVEDRYTLDDLGNNWW